MLQSLQHQDDATLSLKKEIKSYFCLYFKSFLRISKFATIIGISRAIASTSDFVQMLLVSRADDEALAASGLISLIQGFMLGSGVSMLAVIAAKIGKLDGLASCKIKIITNVSNHKLQKLKFSDGIFLILIPNKNIKLLLLDGVPISFGTLPRNMHIMNNKTIVNFNQFSLNLSKIDDRVKDIVRKQLVSVEGAYNEIGENIALCLTKYQIDKYNSISQHLYYSIGLSALISIPFVSLSLCSKFILLGLKLPPEVVEKTQSYFIALSPYFPTVLFFVSIQQALLGTKNPCIATILASSVPILTSILGYILIYPINMGFLGMAFAETIPTFGCSFIAIFVLRSDCLKKYNFFKYDPLKKALCSWPHWKEFARTCLIGFWDGGAVFLVLVSKLATGIIAGMLGKNAMIASQIPSQYFMWLIIPMHSFGQAASVLISRSLARNQVREATVLGNTTLFVCTTFSLGVLTVFWAAPNLLTKPFMSDNSDLVLQENINTMFFIAGCDFLCDSIRNACDSLLTGYQDILFPAACSAFELLLIGVPASYVTSLLTKNIIDVSFSRSCCYFAGALTLLGRWIYRSYISPPTKINTSQQNKKCGFFSNCYSFFKRKIFGDNSSTTNIQQNNNVTHQFN